MDKMAFVSMARKDQSVVQEIVNKLEDDGIPMWVYYRDIAVGRNWRIMAREAIVKASHLIVFLSANSLKSINVRIEIYLARCYGKPVIPVMLEDCEQLIRQYEETKWLVNHQFIPVLSDKNEIAKQIESRINHSIVPESLNTDRIFITYAEEDREFAKAIAIDLRDIGGSVWFDEWNILAGMNVFNSRNSWLMRATYLIVCLSIDSISNEQVKRDIQLALSREIPIIPIISKEDEVNSVANLSSMVVNDELTKDILDINWVRWTENISLITQQLREAFRLFTPETKTKQGIFISYRRDDSAAESGRLYDHITMQFSKSNVYKDVMNIPPGTDFAKHISEYISKCAIILILIGEQWISITDNNGNRRIEAIDDFVRLEVELALESTNTIVIPVLVGEASMPTQKELPISIQKLSNLNAYRVRHDPDFRSDVDKLIEYIKNY